MRRCFNFFSTFIFANLCKKVCRFSKPPHAAVALTRIHEKYQEESTKYAPFVRQLEKYEQLVHTVSSPLPVLSIEESISITRYHQTKQEIITVRRQELEMIRRKNIYSEELIRQKEFELDIEQISIMLT